MDEAVPIEISVEQVKQLMDADDEFLLVDCREPHEYQWCHLDGSQLVPLGQIPEQAGSLGQPDRRIVIYCHHGIRSLRVAHWLRQQGFVQAQSMAGGIDEWSCEIDPAVPRY
ncbi:MAG: rhodanese-like domain-containing protein [Pirellulaceae bacterium]